MSKVIVFCADGTWNGPGQPDADNTTDPPTNVYKLFLNLAGADQQASMMLAKEQERVLKDADGTVLQWSKYLHGVGDSHNFLVQLLGGAIGAGLIARIVRGYTFISRNFVPGDQIVITGFSRGAYTARALAGMIATKGLLDPTKNDLQNLQTGYRLGAAVWYDFRRIATRTNPSWLGKLVDLVTDLPAFFQQTVPSSQLIATRIDTVAVWDTVGSLGIPAYTVTDQRVDLFQFADTALSPLVNHGIHAVAVDERRKDFTPTLWDPDPRIMQALFPGCHSDVGGGFPGPGVETGLSDATLQWMMDQLAARGVAFLTQPAYVPQPNPCATGHETWLSGVWRFLPTGPRLFPAGLYLSEEVVQRAGAAAVIPDPSLAACVYAPSNLPTYLVAGIPAPGVTVA
jgi:uncharacterized protein (DUF2235 family)